MGNGTELLRLLGAQASPGVAPAVGTSTRAGGIDFASLLKQAQSGQLASGREVTIAKGAGVNLSDDQIKRISAAADLAEAQGATRALVMIDGMTLKLDVSMREVTGTADLKKSTVLTGIDAVIDVPSKPGEKPAEALAASIENSKLLDMLAGRRGPNAA